MFRSKLLISAMFLVIVFLWGPAPRLHAHGGGGHGGGGHGGGGHGGFGGHGGYYGGHHGYGYGYGYGGMMMGGFGYGGMMMGGLGYGGMMMGGYGYYGGYGYGYGGLGYGYGGLGYGGLGYGGLGMRGMGYGGMMMGGMGMMGMRGGMMMGGMGYGGYGGMSSGCGCMCMPAISGGTIVPVPAAAPAPANPGNTTLPVPNRVSSASRYTDYYARNSNPASSSAIAARTATSPYLDYYARQPVAASAFHVASQNISRTSATLENSNKARLHLRVPADAVVRLNGKRMRATGEEREYLSPVLEEGATYVYDIHVTWTQEGQQREENREVKVRANKSTTVHFGDASLVKR